MKILPIELVRAADAYTIEHEPVSSINLMERAATQCADWIIQQVDNKNPIHIFCGTGNNGGDGLVIARLLHKHHYSVTTYIISINKKSSSDFEHNLKQLKKIPKATIVTIASKKDLPKILKNDIVIDALFGTGFKGTLPDFISTTIDHINQSTFKIIAIDIPSGLHADASSKFVDHSIIKAAHTLTFQFPKLAFLFAENGPYVGDFTVLDINLHPDYIKRAETWNHFITNEMCESLYTFRTKFSHKGTYGHGLLLAGSYGKIGAAILSAKAALKSGLGLLTIQAPACGYNILQTSIPEALVETDFNEMHLSSLCETTDYKAIAIGPGIGTDIETQYLLRNLLEQFRKPIVLDADALNILSKNKEWLDELPYGSILTPHPKEFERLVGGSKTNFEQNKLQRELSIKHGIYIILKGAHSSITCPDGRCFFNSSGNAGMATAGCGDVLTGILLGLLAQGYSSESTAILGTYLHGLAADMALQYESEESLIASDISNHLGDAFKLIQAD